MGLQNQLTDVSSGSLLVFLLAVIANGVCYIRAILFTFLHSLGLSHYRPNSGDDGLLFDAVGSGLAGLIVLTEQLNLNRAFSYKYRKPDELIPEKCVVCLNRLSEGEQVRKLGCQHEFHKECFDGWLDHMNFNCPLCRTPMVAASHEHVMETRHRVASDVLAWFSM